MAKQGARGNVPNPLQSASYMARVSKEKVKFHEKQLQTFLSDIERSFKDGILTDVQFVTSAPDSTSNNPSCVVECHAALLKKRIPPLWERCESCGCSKQEGTLSIKIEDIGTDVKDIQDLVKSVYSCSSDLLLDKWKRISPTDSKEEEKEKSSSSTMEEVENGVATVTVSEPVRPKEAKGQRTLHAEFANEIHGMLREGEDHDVQLELDDEQCIPAHRFVLASRSRFFEAMLTGSWRESSANTIRFPGISHESLMVILDHLYGSCAALPVSCNIIELAQHADMWELPSLRDSIVFHLQQEYCHFFHKPCKSCLATVPDCLVFSHEHNYAALKESCLRWIHKYLSRSWCQRAFATLPQDVLELCCSYSADQLTLATSITMLTDVDKLCSSLPTVKWADYMRPFCERLFTDTMLFTAQNFTHPMVQRNFRSLLEGLGWSESLVKSLLEEVINQLNYETASTVLILALQLDDARKYGGWNSEASTAISEFYNQCHRFIARNLGKVQYTSTWSNVPAAVQQNLKDAAVFVDDRGPNRAKPVLSSSLKNKTSKEFEASSN
ncbi:hypothetical protein BSL78_20941 [Apostichopus japonicus]|uniref:BTB domain-containing protein n=1 Tax=Stichopus japonicus TaxID=307972 RepID=A0A2G8K2H7_STIJA|nr:hypothetical protein BSL78_20941 [Apostichopus japonicus]